MTFITHPADPAAIWQADHPHVPTTPTIATDNTTTMPSFASPAPSRSQTAEDMLVNGASGLSSVAVFGDGPLRMSTELLPQDDGEMKQLDGFDLNLLRAIMLEYDSAPSIVVRLWYEEKKLYEWDDPADSVRFLAAMQASAQGGGPSFSVVEKDGRSELVIRSGDDLLAPSCDLLVAGIEDAMWLAFHLSVGIGRPVKQGG